MCVCANVTKAAVRACRYLCKYVYVYVRIFVYVYVCIYIYIYIYIIYNKAAMPACNICVYKYSYIYIYIYIYNIHLLLYTCVPTNLHTYIQVGH